MQSNIILAGVGGQGILTIAAVIDRAALQSGLTIRQTEVHGMSQRGGAVQSHLRISDKEIYSDLIPEGAADLILSVEPLEALRYMPFLAPDGRIITSIDPFINIENYPSIESSDENTPDTQSHPISGLVTTYTIIKSNLNRLLMPSLKLLHNLQHHHNKDLPLMLDLV